MPDLQFPALYAEYYDILVHAAPSSPDPREIAFFCRALDEAPPRLPRIALGAATGWHAVALAEEGLIQEAAEPREPLAAILRRKLEESASNAAFVHSPPEDIAAGSRGAVLLLHSALSRSADPQALIQQAFRLLAPGGVLVADCLNLAAQYDTMQASRRYRRPVDGGRIWVTERLALDSAGSCVESSIDGLVERDGSKKFFSYSETLQFMMPAEVRLRMRCAGFVDERQSGDYEWNNMDETNPEQIQFVARRPI